MLSRPKSRDSDVQYQQYCVPISRSVLDLNKCRHNIFVTVEILSDAALKADNWWEAIHINGWKRPGRWKAVYSTTNMIKRKNRAELVIRKMMLVTTIDFYRYLQGTYGSLASAGIPPYPPAVRSWITWCANPIG